MVTAAVACACPMEVSNVLVQRPERHADHLENEEGLERVLIVVEVGGGSDGFGIAPEGRWEVRGNASLCARALFIGEHDVPP